MSKAEERALEAYPYSKGRVVATGFGTIEFDQNHDERVGFVKGYKQAEKDFAIKCEKRSPITGGEMQLMQEKSSVKFRGEEVVFTKKFYHCVDSGQDFTDTELDNDNMWAIFRAYCEKLGYHSFKDIVLITDIVTVRDAGLSWKDIERIITIENDMIAQYDRAMLDQMPEAEYYKEILKRFNKTKV